MTPEIDEINQAAIDAGEIYASRPPESMRPSRDEVTTAVGGGVGQSLDVGVTIEWLVGAHTDAHNLATGIITCAPGRSWLPHQHPHFASLTLLQGDLLLKCGSLQYDLQPLDNAVVSPDTTHALINPSSHQPAVLHVAYPVTLPITSRCDPGVPIGSQCARPLIHVTRHATAQRYEASNNASFIDYFNDSLMPGIPMCGGYGLFAPGGRLPAHIHDFDESICIVQGTATCWVEGKTYDMSGYTTALQPRGRVHYFINNTDQPMAMIWVYAGPTTARLVVDERCGIEPDYAWPE